MTPEAYNDEHDHTIDDTHIQCHSCKEWWDEDDADVPHISDWCVDNTHAYCDECRREMNNDE